MNKTGRFCCSMFCSASFLVLCGCIPNRPYRPVVWNQKNDRSAIAIQPPSQLPVPANSGWPKHPEDPCDDRHLLGAPCMAFLEFDDLGEVWQKSPSGRPSQLQRICDLIAEAKKQDPQGEPLILTFIHGWKHNAHEGNRDGDDDSNIIGLAAVLSELHAKTWTGHVVLGIYIAWRGGLISPYWPVAQQFTYWNREAAAIRTGNTSLTEALIEISDSAKAPVLCKPNDACYSICGAAPLAAGAIPDCRSRLLFVGHSFGALVLERALSQAIVTRMEMEWDAATREGASIYPATTIKIEPIATLVIYVNSAAAAIESKSLMDYLASSHFTYRPDPNGGDRPLFLAVTSEADDATGIFLKIGHSVPWLGFHMNGSLRDKSQSAVAGDAPTERYARACYDPLTDEKHSHILTDLSQSDYYMATTAHTEALWSHKIDSGAPVGKVDPAIPCVERSDGNPPAGTPVYASCQIAGREYWIRPIENRCNGTPYWVIQIPKELVPDHNTIFTGRFVAFLRAFFPTPGKPLPVLLKAE